jgi:hypothetical protein
LGATRPAGNPPLNSAQLEEQRKEKGEEAYKNNDQRPLPSTEQNIPRQEIHAMAAAQERREQADNQKASQ